MPRGNDPTPPHQLADEFGAGAGTAEELIEGNQGRRSELLDRASLKPVDPDATLDLDLDKLEGPNGEAVWDAAVRGGIRIVVFEDDEGRMHKTELDKAEKLDEKVSRRLALQHNVRAKAKAAKDAEEAKK